MIFSRDLDVLRSVDVVGVVAAVVHVNDLISGALYHKGWRRIVSRIGRTSISAFIAKSRGHRGRGPGQALDSGHPVTCPRVPR